MPIQPGKTMARRKRSEHYVNNKEFLAALITYREDIEITTLGSLVNLQMKKVEHLLGILNQ